MVFFCYKNENIRYTESDLNLLSQKNNSCILHTPMFTIAFNTCIQIKLEYVLNP